MKKDLSGKRFGRLTVESEAEPYRSPAGKPTRRWRCSCDCGRECVVLQNQLTAGKARSCGCLQRETAAEKAADLTGQRFGRWTVIERAVLPKRDSSGAVNGWLCECDCGTRRVVLARNLVSGSSRSCGCDTAQKAALRIKSDGENVLGFHEGTALSAISPERKINSNNTSGVKGVYWSAREGAWVAKIMVKGKSITIGRFSRLEDAAAARRAAEDEYFEPIRSKYNEKG